VLGKPNTAYLSENQEIYKFLSDYTIKNTKCKKNNLHKVLHQERGASK